MKLLKAITIFGYIILATAVQSQATFTNEIMLACGDIEDQQKTGTCWSFSSSSYFESELLRMGHEYIDLSEMYIVRHIYLEKGMNYVLRQGNATFGQGSLAHDFLNAADKYGLVPENEFSGRKKGNADYDHSDLAKSLEEIVREAVKKKQAPAEWLKAYKSGLDEEIGSEPAEFTYEGNIYTPNEFYRALPIRKEDYIHLTSFTHHPFYSSFILEIPDNFSNGSYYNIPLEELTDIAKNALEKGYTLVWDGDVSEKGFQANMGKAILESNEVPSQLNRQSAFMNFQTTDDHLMHIVGSAKDEQGEDYFIVKNSWGEIGPFEGYLYMSVPYFKMKTVAITVHKDAVQDEILKKQAN